MLDKQDLQDIRGVVREEVHQVVSDLMEHNILPHFDVIHEELADVKSDVGTLKSDVSTLKADVGTLKVDVGTLKVDVGTLKADVSMIKATMVTRDFLEDRLSDFKASLKIGAQTVNAKMNRMTQVLHKKNLLTVLEINQINGVL